MPKIQNTLRYIMNLISYTPLFGPVFFFQIATFSVNLQGSRAHYRHKDVGSNSTLKYRAIDDATSLVDRPRFSTGHKFVGVSSPDYLSWSANRVSIHVAQITTL
jgi:hypothetical protein